MKNSSLANIQTRIAHASASKKFQLLMIYCISNMISHRQEHEKGADQNKGELRTI
jgi:hypothetical protein